MQIKRKGSTNNIKTKKGSLEFSSNCGGVCYSEHGFHKTSAKTNRRIRERLLNSAHHSPFDQPSFNFEFNDIPKFGAMILNNQRPYTTSEKSARYKKMELSGEQEEVYEKWKGIFQTKIKEECDFLDDVKIGKLAQENARYLTSVFTPTHMVHELSFRQLSYFVHWFNDFVGDSIYYTGKDTGNDFFDENVSNFAEEFNNIVMNDLNLFEERLDPKIKKIKLSIFADRDNYEEEFGENYSTSYKLTFAQLAQTHRHRLLDYEIVDIRGSLENMEFFVPPILGGDPELVKEWEKDMSKVSEQIPQGMLINIHETGKYQDFISKATERLCEQAQWEIMDRTKKTLDKYIEGTKNTNPYVYSELLKYSKGPKCTFPGVKCKEPGPFGSKLALERLV